MRRPNFLVAYAACAFLFWIAPPAGIVMGLVVTASWIEDRIDDRDPHQ